MSKLFNSIYRRRDDWNSLPSELKLFEQSQQMNLKTYWTNIGMMKDVNPPLSRYYNLIGVGILAEIYIIILL